MEDDAAWRSALQRVALFVVLAAGFQCNELTQELVMDETDIDVDWINAVVVKGTEVLADNEGTQ